MEESDVPAAKRAKQSISVQVLELEQQLCTDLHQLQYPHPITHVYNPLDYARETHSCFINHYGDSTKTILFLGMNPGPFGMAQNGVCMYIQSSSTTLCDIGSMVQ